MMTFPFEMILPYALFGLGVLLSVLLVAAEWDFPMEGERIPAGFHERSLKVRRIICLIFAASLGASVIFEDHIMCVVSFILLALAERATKHKRDEIEKLKIKEILDS